MLHAALAVALQWAAAATQPSASVKCATCKFIADTVLKEADDPKAVNGTIVALQKTCKTKFNGTALKICDELVKDLIVSGRCISA